MRRFLYTFLFGAVAGAAAYHYVTPLLESNTQLGEARAQFGEEAGKLKNAVQETYNDWAPERIKEELARTSVVIRERAKQAGVAVWDATANARLTAAIKTKFLAEPGVPGMSINVDSAGGVVTLSGTVRTAEEISRAMRLAMDTEGVTKVVSTLQLNPSP